MTVCAPSTGERITAVADATRHTRRKRQASLLGWSLAVVLVLATAVALRRFEVPLPTTAVFLAYVLLGIAIPGTLVWRAVCGRSATLAGDLAAGTALGYVIEVFAYVPARALGMPLLVLAVPVGVITVFVACPTLREHWKPQRGGEPVPLWWPVGVFSMVAFLIGWSCLAFFRAMPIGSPGYTATDFDMPHHLALVGEIKHHMLPTVPWVDGEPLYYHWFVYVDMAATSWVTGIEPLVLLYRLSLLPMLAAFAVLIAELARRMTGQWWAGLVAVVMTFLVISPDPYGWRLSSFATLYGFGVVEDGALLGPEMWASPTQTFGGLLSALLVLVLVDLVRNEDIGRGIGRWVLVAFISAALMGAKATYLPLVLCGLAMVVCTRLVLFRRLHRAALVAAGVVLGCLVFAQFVLFGNAQRLLVFAPLTTTKWLGLTTTTQFLGGDPPLWRTVFVVLLCLLCWSCVWSGILGLIRRRLLLRPDHLLLLGIGLSGLAVLMAYSHPGMSQFFFIESAKPYLAVLASCGLAALISAGGRTWRTSVAMLMAACLGAGVVWAIRIADGPAVPVLTGTGRPRRVALAMGWPYLVMCVAVLAVGLALYLGRRRISCVRGNGLALLLAMTTGLGLPSGMDQIANQAVPNPNGLRLATMAFFPITPGTLEAGRWLRDHSSPDDLVATNAHCRSAAIDVCNICHFSVAAFTERRVLVEGWGYTSTVEARAARAHQSFNSIPFWKPEVLADNDAAFYAPSAATIGRLRDRYGVRWLMADEASRQPAATLAAYATLRFQAGSFAVYEIVP